MKRIAWWEWVLVATLVALGFFLRARDLTAFKLSPDDGQYMNSARLQTLERSTDPVQWIEEDAAWFGEMREDWGNSVKVATTYQHSYLHQFLFRYGYRFGLARVEALRMNSAVLGALSIALLWGLYAWLFPERRRVGLVAAALLSVLLVHVFQSRTGWGQIGAACFFLVLFAAGWKLLARTDERDTRSQVRLALVLLLASVLGMGFQEMTSVLVVGLVLMALAAPWWREPRGPKFAEHVLRSRVLRAVLVSAIPVGAYTLALRFFSEYAREKWFTLELYKDLSWWDLRVAAVRKFFVIDHVYAQLSLPVLVLAAIGVRATWKRDRAWCRHCVGWVFASSVFLFFVFNDPTLLRVYLPAMLVVVLLAAEGLVFAAEQVAESVARGAAPRIARALAACATVVLCAWLGARTWTTVFGDEDDALFEPGVYVGIPNSRNADQPWLEYLEDHRVTSELGVWPAKDPLFVAADAGFRARLFSFDEPQTTWTDYLLAVQNSMRIEARRVEDGGRYRLLVADASGRVGLYALQAAQ